MDKTFEQFQKQAKEKEKQKQLAQEQIRKQGGNAVHHQHPQQRIKEDEVEDIKPALHLPNISGGRPKGHHQVGDDMARHGSSVHKLPSHQSPMSSSDSSNSPAVLNNSNNTSGSSISERERQRQREQERRRREAVSVNVR